jgi:hypothetical protein
MGVLIAAALFAWGVAAYSFFTVFRRLSALSGSPCMRGSYPSRSSSSSR